MRNLSTRRGNTPVAGGANATGAGAISLTYAPTHFFDLLALYVHFSAALTTSESLTVTLDSVLGTAYDTVLFSVDPSIGAATDIVHNFEKLQLRAGDAVVVAYTNTDAVTYGVHLNAEVY